jgi:nucleotide-binding universal stress UspA family protein
MRCRLRAPYGSAPVGCKANDAHWEWTCELKCILVGVDGSEAAAAALGWAGRLAQLVGAEVVVANVFESGQAEVSPGRRQELMLEAERRLEAEWSEPLSGCAAPRRSVLVTGAPDVLLDAADGEDADLVVVGPRGHGGFAGLHVGSLAHHLAQHTTRPLAIVPAPGAAGAFDRVVVGVDGSEGSGHAVRWCADMARAAHAEVIAVYAFEPLVEWVLESDPRSWRQAADRKLEDSWAAPLRQAGVAVRTRIVENLHPVAALSGVVEDEGADLVVVGTRGIGGFLGLRLGRVPVQLVHHTQMPVVLVPPPVLDPLISQEGGGPGSSSTGMSGMGDVR